MNRANESAKSENKKLSHEITQCQEKNDQLRSELDALLAKFNANIEYVNQQAKMIDQLKSIQFDLQESLKTQRMAYESENESLRDMLDQVKAKYEDAVLSKEGKRNQIDTTARSLEIIEQLRDELGKSQQKLQDMDLECKKLNAKLNQSEMTIQVTKLDECEKGKKQDFVDLDINDRFVNKTLTLDD